MDVSNEQRKPYASLPKPLKSVVEQVMVTVQTVLHSAFTENLLTGDVVNVGPIENCFLDKVSCSVVIPVQGLTTNNIAGLMEFLHRSLGAGTVVSHPTNNDKWYISKKIRSPGKSSVLGSIIGVLFILVGLGLATLYMIGVV